MTKSHHATAHQIIDLLAAKPEPGPEVGDPEAWRKAVRNRLRSEHWPTLMALLAPSSNAELVETIVGLLAVEPGSALHHTEPVNPSSAVADYAADEPWEPLECEEREHAVERIAAIKAALRGEPK